MKCYKLITCFRMSRSETKLYYKQWMPEFGRRHIAPIAQTTMRENSQAWLWNLKWLEATGLGAITSPAKANCRLPSNNHDNALLLQSMRTFGGKGIHRIRTGPIELSQCTPLTRQGLQNHWGRSVKQAIKQQESTNLTFFRNTSWVVCIWNPCTLPIT